MAHRHKVHEHHKHKARGGRTVYEGGGSKTAHEAEDDNAHKRGGKVTHMHGHKGKHRIDKRARGGRTGGSDTHPFSSAHTR